MKFSYNFQNLLGAVYRQGDLIFSSDGNRVISPVGNRITIYDLRNNKASTLPIESRFNYTALDLSPNGCVLIAVNEEGEAHMISLISRTIVHKYRFKRKVNAVKFSPDGKHFAVCKENNVFIFKTPGPFSGEYNGFVMERVFHGNYDETTCLDWTSDSRILAIGSKDQSVKLHPLDKWKNFKFQSLSSHRDEVVACFFEENSFDITTICRDGQTSVWESTIDPDKLIPNTEEPPRKKKRAKRDEDEEEDDIDTTKSMEQTDEELAAALKDVALEEENKEDNKLYYKRLAVHYLADEVRKERRDAVLTAAAYHKRTKVLVTGFSTGAFFIHEMPDMNMIHSLSVSEQTITSISLNNTGDWIAIGCGGLGQLLVWEWQSETYVMKQQGHTNNMSCLAYSGDGQMLATGGEDGKLKLWNVHSGFCTVTFSEHTTAVTDVAFSGNKKFVVSASLDGTVRAYDVIRYRNFRTLTTPRPVQLQCVSVDYSGEFIAAGAQDVFEIYLWSVKFGRLLDVLSGHEGPVWSLAFSPSPASTMLASASWDKSIRIWDALEKGSAHETIELTSDSTCVVFKPDGKEVAVATLDGNICVFRVEGAYHRKTIEGKNDLSSGRLDTDLVSAKQSLKAKAFTTLCYSANGECLLAGGQSKNVCIYNVEECMLLKKFEITQNRSFDGVDDFINRRKLKEFGNVDLVEEREDGEGGNVTLRLPGVKKGDLAARSFRPEVRVFCLQFSPTGQQWAAATTEGLLVYSLNVGLVFDPWDLQVDITPKAVRNGINKHDYVNALVMSMKLNEAALINEVMEKIPADDIELVVSNISDAYINRLLVIVATALDNSNHIEFYLTWIQHLFTIHGPKIKAQLNMPALISIQKSLNRRYEQLAKLCNFNKYTMMYVSTLGKMSADGVKMETNGVGEAASNGCDSENSDEGVMEVDLL